MKSLIKIIKRSSRRIIAAALLSSVLGGVIIAQTQKQKSNRKSPKSPPGQTSKTTLENPVREQALAALETVLAESKTYDDEALRIRVKAQVADVLWAEQPERAQTLISEAFAETSNLTGELAARYAVRAEVIAVARRHNPKLAAKLIDTFDKQLDDANSKEQLARDSFEQITERGAHYLDSARASLSDGNQEQSLTFARRSLNQGRSAQFIWFLNELRERDRAAADRIFLEALNALRSGAADPNDVLHLGLYLFYPGSLVAGTLPDGVDAVSYGVNFNAAASPPIDLVRPYLQAAASALLRFQVVPGQPGSSGSIELKRFALRQLLPLFQRYEPELLDQIAATLANLNSAAPPSTPGTTPRRETLDTDALSTEEAIEKIERLADVKQRDHYFFAAARGAIDKGDFERATKLAERISESELKNPTLELVNFNHAQVALKQGKLEEAAELAASQLTAERRAVMLFQIASESLKRKNFVLAESQIAAATLEAAKTEDAAQRARLYIYLAAGLAERDATRAFEIFERAVTAINLAENFDPLNDNLMFIIKSSLGSYSMNLSRGIGLVSVIKTLSQADVSRALDLAQRLRPATPRALSVITACRAALKEKAKPAVKPNPQKQVSPKISLRQS